MLKGARVQGSCLRQACGIQTQGILDQRLDSSQHFDAEGAEAQLAASFTNLRRAQRLSSVAMASKGKWMSCEQNCLDNICCSPEPAISA